MDAVRSWLGLPPQGGPTGAGVRVAVIDTGVDLTHPDFQPTATFPAPVVAAARPGFAGRHGIDASGHGTHVAGIIAGRGTASQGRYAGVAPGAELVVYNVHRTGRQLDGALVARALNDVLSLAPPLILNYSAGFPAMRPSSSDPTTLEPLAPPWVWAARGWKIADAFARLAAHGVLPVVAAGNVEWEAATPGTVFMPAVSPAVLAVGTRPEQPVKRPYSAQGPAYFDDQLAPGTVRRAPKLVTKFDIPILENTRTGAGRRARPLRVELIRFFFGPVVRVPKPDVHAPGDAVVGPRSRGAPPPGPDGTKPAPPGFPAYMPDDGTSVAAPVISGLAACALQQLTPSIPLIPLNTAGRRNVAGILRVLIEESAAPPQGASRQRGGWWWPQLEQRCHDFARDPAYRSRVVRAAQ